MTLLICHDADLSPPIQQMEFHPYGFNSNRVFPLLYPNDVYFRYLFTYHWIITLSSRFIHDLPKNYQLKTFHLIPNNGI